MYDRHAIGPCGPALIVERVKSVLKDEDSSALGGVVYQDSRTADRNLTELELDLNDWGFALGVAWALIRLDDPFAPSKRVQEAAVTAAQIAWADWEGPTASDWMAKVTKDRERRGPAPGDPGTPEYEEMEMAMLIATTPRP